MNKEQLDAAIDAIDTLQHRLDFRDISVEHAKTLLAMAARKMDLLEGQIRALEKEMGEQDARIKALEARLANWR